MVFLHCGYFDLSQFVRTTFIEEVTSRLEYIKVHKIGHVEVQKEDNIFYKMKGFI